MSEPRLISPLLDGFVMGPSMSAHPGVQSCPAMPQDSDKRYIVKIISIPASAEQLEAMLLTGAFSNQKDALAYFKDQAERAVEEIGVLKKLSSLEGFLAFENWQLAEKENEHGYELYMLSPYKLSLEQHIKRHTMTQLNAVNLGLDMCAALAVCRRAGYLYVNLKPENIFMSEDKEYRIGDLGFVSMDSLKYTALDGRYHSPYSAPECLDLFATVNTTVDTYAAGMILYQVYNDGKLPQREADGQLPSPEYADYEMAEIILKAIDIDPAKRWKDPIAMGQAIVTYMQKNGANDVPIVPPAIPVAPVMTAQAVAVEAVFEEASAEETFAEETFAEDAVEENVPPDTAVAEENIEEIPAEDTAEDTAEEALETIDEKLPAEEATESTEEDLPAEEATENTEEDLPAEDEDAFLEQIHFLLGEEDPCEEAEAFASVMPDAAEPEQSSQEDTPFEENEPEFIQEELTLPDPPEAEAEDVSEVDDPANLAFMQFLVNDETAPSEDMASQFGYDELSAEASDILALADDLLKHKTPGGVVAPEPIDVPVPPPIIPEPEAEQPCKDLTADPALAAAPGAETEEASQDEYEEDYDDDYDDEPSSFSWKKLLIAALILLLIGGICAGGYYYYQNYYLLEIEDLEVVGSGNKISVQVVSDIDDDLITIECIDNNGTKRTSGVIDGFAQFADLNPDTLYRIHVNISGKHKVKGEQEARYTTPKITNIISFTAVAGAEDGSVTLRFKVDGQNAKSWNVEYSTKGEPAKSQPFADDVVTITGLTVGKTYTFRLTSDESVYIIGNDTLQYTATALVMAQNVQITGCDNGKLTVKWDAPEGQSVNSWTVRCYNEDLGYSQSVTTAETTAEFAVEDTTKGYTIAVTAEGMTTPTRAFLKPGSITIRDFKYDDTDPTKLVVSWQYGGPAPEGEWLLMYNVDGSEEKAVIRTSISDSVVIPNKIPNAEYTFTVTTQAGVTVFNDTHTVNTGDAPKFNSYKISSEDIVFRMCKTPKKDNWTYKDVESVTSTFKVGEKASFTMSLRLANAESHDQITILYVIRNSEGKVISSETSTEIWINMWKSFRGELDVPSLPETEGNYTISIYFNGYSVHSQQFTMTK